MQLKLYDTLTRKKRDFVPLDWGRDLPESERRVRMYVCGPTVYDFAHIGNARPVIVFDVLFRLLRHLYGEDRVVYVRNVTDVDDKINARATKLYPDESPDVAIRQLTEQTYSEFKRDVEWLRCLKPTVEPRATEHIVEIKEIIKRLKKSGHAYVAKSHVLFHVPSMPHYGQLSKRPLDEMIAGARIEVAPYKRNPMDFVLWKPSKPGEPAWPSPLGIKRPGRPGWHIECSAMAWKHLGEMFDIHGGGIDLIFPHHENEIAQSKCAFHIPRMAELWVHNGFLQLEGDKMAKSLGNVITIRELRRTENFGGRKWSGETTRLAMLQTHYREPIDWTVRLLEQSEARLTRWKEFAADRTVRKGNLHLMDAFFEAISNDLNTPAAFAEIDKAVNERGWDEDRYAVYQILGFLGFKRRKSRVAAAAEDLRKIIRNLGNFSQNDWKNFGLSVANRPTFKSGNFKPESKLIMAMEVVSELLHRLKGIGMLVGSSNELEALKRQLLEEALPAENQFEVEVRRLVHARDKARADRDFDKADQIRNELESRGVVVKDNADGTSTWELKKND